MNCPKCGTENKNKNKFCVKCGSNLEDPAQVNIESVDMGGYRSEEDYASEKNSFKIGSGTFTISDRAPDTSSGMFTADELNDTDEEFDFSSFDEPFIPKLDADRIAVPKANKPVGMPNQPQGGMAPMGGMPQMGGAPAGFPQQGGMPQMGAPTGFPQQGGMPQMGGAPAGMAQMGGMPQMGAPTGFPQQMYGQPMMAQPQIVGYDQNGMPIYGQPQPMMAQPQIVGYDQNGMPIYGQPQPMMAQPQIVGYDQNGMPIYGQAQPMMAPQIVGYDQNGMPIYGQPQPMMFAQPQIVGYDQNGMPVYGQPQPMMAQPQGGMPAMGGAAPQPQTQQQAQPQQQKQVKVSNEFWNNFFGDEDKSDDEDGQDDFFSKPRHDASRDMGGVSAEGMDLSRLKKQERRKTNYMNDTPEVDASALKPNTDDKINKMYMRGAVAKVDAGELQAKSTEKTKDIMGVTADVDAENLEVFERKKPTVVMNQAAQANAEELAVYEHEHKESIMDQALEAVEALPKKKTIVDEIDAIELPEYMQAKKTVHKESFEIPGLPDVK